MKRVRSRKAAEAGDPAGNSSHNRAVIRPRGEHHIAGRGRPTFNKRQKEQKRTEKRQEKEARRAERKANSQPLATPEMIAEEAAEMARRAALGLDDEEEDKDYLSSLDRVEPLS